MKIQQITRESSKYSKELQEIISECLLYHHTEMFFTGIFRQVIFKEFPDCKDPRILNQAFTIYKKLCTVILKLIYEGKSDYFIPVTDEDFLFIYRNYKDVLEYATSYDNVIPQYIIPKHDILKLIEIELNDDTVGKEKFVKLCMVEGYEIAFQRISNLLDCLDYIAFEEFSTKNSKVLKLYLTPFGSLMKNEIVELVKSGDFDVYIDNILLPHGYTRIVDKDIVDQFKTTQIFSKENEKGLYFFKRRVHDMEYMPFGEQDRKVPLRALIMQGQLNLTYTEDMDWRPFNMFEF